MEYHLTSASKEADYQKRFTQVYGDGLRVITDRIYIADEIKNIEVYDRWTDAIKRLGETNDFDAFNDRFERLRNDIVKSARKSHRS